MRRKVPSTRSLQAFEAAARHDSFSRAAEELSLTEGAISRQISRLESLLKCKLFDRVGNRVILNAVGKNYVGYVSEILGRLDRETQYIQGLPQGSQCLEISSIPTFANRWLIPRLGSFQKNHPDIIINITVRTEPFILMGSGFDAAIHFINSAWTGMHTQILIEEYLIPVCHPTLLSGFDLTEQLLRLPRIHRHQNPEAWEEYAKEYDIPFKYPAQGVRYDLHEMAISAALAGLGIALVPSIYVENELKNGLLIAPWLASKTLKKQFCLVRPSERGVNHVTLMAFEKWLKTQSIR